jgi:ATP-dependent helicase/nuclease subunit B
MHLEIVRGMHNSGKTKYIYDKIKELSRDMETSCILLVPEQTTYEKEKEIIGYLDTEGIINIRILSLKRLAFAVLEETGGIKTPFINDYGKIMILRNIMRKKKGDLSVFKKTSSHKGMYKEFNRLINEFKSCGISIDFIKAVSSSITDDENLKNKLSDIGIVYEELKKHLDEKFLDDEDTISYSSKKIYESNMVKNSHVFLDEFENFTVNEMKFLSELVKYSKDSVASVTLPLDNDFEDDIQEEFESGKKMIADLKSFSEDGVKVEEIFMEVRKSLKDDIGFLSSSIFCYDNVIYEGEPENISFFYAVNPYEEIKTIADMIISDVRDKGYRWKDIALVTGDENQYAINVEKVFSEYEIPYFIDQKREIMSHPLVAMILSILDIGIKNYRQSDIARFLKCGYTDLEISKIEDLENYAIKYGISGYKWKMEFKYGSGNIEELEVSRKSVVNLLKDVEGLVRESTWEEKINILLHIITDLNIYEKIKNETYELRNREMFEEAYENSQIWNSMMEIFEQTVNISGESETGIREFRDIIKTGFEEFSLSIIPPEDDCVVLGIIGKTLVEKKKVYFVGMNEGNVPSLHTSQGILYEDERDYLIEKGAGMFSNNDDISLEKFKIGKIINSVREGLVFSYSLGDVEGRTLRPSTYADRIKSLFPEMNISGGILEKGDMPEKIRPSLNYISEKIRENINGSEMDIKDKNLLHWIRGSSNDFSCLMDDALSYDNKAVIEDENLVGEVFDMPLKMSPYSIENYSTCPFKYFIENGLKPVAREEYKIDYKDIGSLYHKIIEEVTNKIIEDEEFIEKDTDQLKEEVKNISEAVFSVENDSNELINDSDRNKYIRSKIESTTEKAAISIVKQLKNSEFKPIYSEASFGMGKDEMNPVELKNEKGSVYLRGRIDRIDVYKGDEGSYINIIDYKSSNKNIDLNDVINGLQIQLFLYMDAVIKYNSNIFENNGSFGGVFYFHIDNPMLDGDIIDAEDIDGEIFKKFSLKGYAIDDINIINKMDVNFIENRSSQVLESIKITKKEKFSATSKILKEEHIKKLLFIIEKKIIEVSDCISKGVIEIKPYKYRNRIPCDYCDLISICQFDNALEGNEYNRLKYLKKEEIMEILEEGDGEND